MICPNCEANIEPIKIYGKNSILKNGRYKLIELYYCPECKVVFRGNKEEKNV